MVQRWLGFEGGPVALMALCAEAVALTTALFLSLKPYVSRVFSYKLEHRGPRHFIGSLNSLQFGSFRVLCVMRINK
jgi:hypothetical protein